jgi:hypothetical protein
MRNITDWNERRTRQLGAEQVTKAQAALDLFERAPTKNVRDRSDRETHTHVLIARVGYCNSTLAEIAEAVGLTKDAYWSKLRRAPAYAERLETRTRINA